MDEQSLKDRFMRFAISVLRFTEKFPKQTSYFIIEKQLIRCSSGSASGYRAVCRARSLPDFIYKLGNVEEELDETLFWLEYTEKVDKRWEFDILPIHLEGNELISIIVKSIDTSKKKLTPGGSMKK